MTILKTLHDTDSGEPTRIKYDSDLVYVGFNVITTAGTNEPTRRVAELDCIATYELHDTEEQAFVELEQVQEAIGAVIGAPYIDDVTTLFDNY